MREKRELIPQKNVLENFKSKQCLFYYVLNV